MFCTRFDHNTGRKKSPKVANSAPSHNLSGYIFVTKAHIDNRDNLVKHQYVLHMSS